MKTPPAPDLKKFIVGGRAFVRADDNRLLPAVIASIAEDGSSIEALAEGWKVPGRFSLTVANDQIKHYIRIAGTNRHSELLTYSYKRQRAIDDAANARSFSQLMEELRKANSETLIGAEARADVTRLIQEATEILKSKTKPSRISMWAGCIRGDYDYDDDYSDEAFEADVAAEITHEA